MIELYDGDVQIEFMPKSHRYKANGAFVPGVSSILGVLHKDLMDWAVFMAVGSFQEAAEPYLLSERKMSKMGVKQLVENAKKAHKMKSQHGMDVGTLAHDYIAKRTVEYMNKEVFTLTGSFAVDTTGLDEEFVKQLTNCLNAWRKWVDDYQVEPILSEKIVYSRELAYCGTFDLLFKSNRTGKTYMADYKTSEPKKIRNYKYVITGYEAYPEHFMQCAAYDYAHNEETGDEVDGYAVIYLPKEGDYAMFERSAVDTDRDGWETLVDTYKWITKVRKQQ